MFKKIVTASPSAHHKHPSHIKYSFPKRVKIVPISASRLCKTLSVDTALIAKQQKTCAAFHYF